MTPDAPPERGLPPAASADAVLAHIHEGGALIVPLANGEPTMLLDAVEAAGEVVTNSKNTVDMVVTEFGVAELRARTVRERTTALIAVAHPDHRDHLTAEARRLGYV